MKVLASTTPSPTTPIPSASAPASAPASCKPSLPLFSSPVTHCQLSHRSASSRRFIAPCQLAPRPTRLLQPGCARTLGVSAEQEPQLVASHKQPSCLSHRGSHRIANNPPLDCARRRQRRSQPPLPLGALPSPTPTSPQQPVPRALSHHAAAMIFGIFFASWRFTEIVTLVCPPPSHHIHTYS